MSRDFRGTIVREHGGHRSQSGFSVVVTKQDFTHQVTWQVYYDTKHGLPEIGARIQTAHGDLVDVRWDADHKSLRNGVDSLWVCQEHGQGDCWHARTAQEAIPEVPRRVIRAVGAYRAYEEAWQE